MKRIILNLNEELIEKLDKECLERGCSRSWLIRKKLQEEIKLVNPQDETKTITRPSVPELRKLIEPIEKPRKIIYSHSA